jgi:hypothetical protein
LWRDHGRLEHDRPDPAGEQRRPGYRTGPDPGIDRSVARVVERSQGEGGKKVTKLFDQYFQSSVDGVTAARQKLATADPGNVAFAADIAQFTAALQTLQATTGDPFSKLSSNQSLLQALKKEKTCSKIVTVYGG